jgi:Tol biopolymer transport system component
MRTTARVLLTIVVLAAVSPAQEIQPKFVLAGHKSMVIDTAFSPDGRKLLTTGSNDRTMRLWNTATGLTEKVFTKKSVLYFACFSPDGKTVATSSFYPQPQLSLFYNPEQTVELWDLNTGENRVIRRSDYPERVRALTFSPDGRLLAIGTSAMWKGRIYIWDMTARRMKTCLEDKAYVSIDDVRFSRNGSMFAAPVNYDGICLWDTETSGLLTTLTLRNKHERGAISISLSQDGMWLTSASSEPNINIWYLGTNTLSRTIGGFNTADSLAYSPDGTLLAVACSDGKLHVLDAKTYEQRVATRAHRSFVSRVAFSPDGKLIATSSGDHTAKLWETAAFVRALKAQQEQGRDGKTEPDRPAAGSRRPRAEQSALKAMGAKEILARLDRPVTMRYPKGISLERFVTEISRATAEKNDAGIPVYLDPIGLLMLDLVATSPVTIDVQDVPLKQALAQVLTQLGMERQVLDGVLILSAADEIEETYGETPTIARDDTARTRAAMAILDRTIALDYPDLTPLEEVLADIRKATKGPGDATLSIRLSPEGLENADKTATSPVTMALKGVPLKTTLRLLLAQLGMGYFVKDGTLIVTDVEAARNGLEASPPPPP